MSYVAYENMIGAPIRKVYTTNVVQSRRPPSVYAMSEPRIEMPDLAMFAAIENSPDGLLGKLACVSKAFYKACREEANRRARAAGRNIPPGGVPLPPVIARLLTTPGEVEWALQPGSKCLTAYPEHLTASIAAGGSIPALEMVSKKGRFIPDSLFRPASRNGHQDVLQWARERGCPWHFLTCSDAAWGGHLDLLKWAIQNGAPHELSRVSGSAAMRGHFEVVKWYIDLYGWEWDDHTCFEAAGIGRLDILKWAREHGAPWDVMTCARAALGGHVEVLQWARDNGAPWNEWTCSDAAKAGHLNVLKWARDNGAPWDEWTCSNAAEAGHLNVLKWARDNGAPWDEITCTLAAKKGHLGVLKWVRDNGAPWNDQTCFRAAQRGHLEVLKWAIANGAPHGNRGLMWGIANHNGHKEVAEWIESALGYHLPRLPRLPID